MTIRHDDFDFRMGLEDYREIHEQFIEKGLTETAVIQFTHHGFPSWKPKLVEYLNTAPNWDIQLHCWAHDPYDKMSFPEIVRDLAACFHLFSELFGRKPTIWFPPWNGKSPEMVETASIFGLTINNESNDIAKFIREYDKGVKDWHSLYFHGWNNNERVLVPEMLKRVLALEKECIES